MSPRHDAFPLAAVSSLIGILRELYRSERAAGAAPERLAAIAAVGQQLREADDLARRCDTGTLGHTAAWRKAEAGTAAFCALVDDPARAKAAPDIKRVTRRG
jgi:hypothetical protein